MKVTLVEDHLRFDQYDFRSDLLEPFVDTEFTDATKRVTTERLAKAGITEVEVEEIRHRIGPLMIAYNIHSGLWDWTNLNLFDLLNAASGQLVPPNVPAAE